MTNWIEGTADERGARRTAKAAWCLYLAVALGATACGRFDPRRALSSEPSASASASSSAPGGAAPFSGTFEVLRGVDAKTGKAFDFHAEFGKRGTGQMLWGVKGNDFTLSIWTVNRKETEPGDHRAAVCSAQATVAASWHGMTLSVPAVAIKGTASAVHTFDKGARTQTLSSTCEANTAAQDVVFEIVEKNATGPTRLVAKSPLATFELARANPVEKLDPEAVSKPVK